jgi:hypothetical protein
MSPCFFPFPSSAIPEHTLSANTMKSDTTRHATVSYILSHIIMMMQFTMHTSAIASIHPTQREYERGIRDMHEMFHRDVEQHLTVSS